MINEPADWADIKAKIMQRHTEVGDCWEWRSYMKRGRPVLHYTNTVDKSVDKPVRQLVALLWGRKVPAGHNCLVSCKNPLCVNPEHIVVVPKKEALRRASKAAVENGNHKLRIAKIAEAQRARNAKLNWEKVREIRASDAPHKQLSEMYGVAAANIGRIKRNKMWIEHTAKANPFAPLMR